MGCRVTQACDSAALVRKRRLETAIATGPIAQIATSLTAIILAAAFYGVVPHPALAAWLLLAFILLAIRHTIIRAATCETLDGSEVRTHLNRIVAAKAATSIFWAASFVLFARYASGERLALLILVAALTFVGTMLLHRGVPRASFVHLTAILIGITLSALTVAGSAAIWVVLLLVPYALILARFTISQDRAFVEATIGENMRLENEQTVRLLLNEYETQAQDCLWSVGPRGRLRDVSQRLANFLGQDIEAVEGTPFGDLFIEGRQRTRLVDLLANRVPFRDEIVKLDIRGQTRIWRVSGRPKANGFVTGVLRDVTEAFRTEERVRYLALHDDLTGLANRHAFTEHLRERMGLTGDPVRRIALFYLDLDDFKAINDTFGHRTADAILCEVGWRLKSQLREADLVARLAADEFAIVIESALGDGMLIERGHRLLAAMREPFLVEDRLIEVSGSVGIARCSEEACEAEELVRRADLAIVAAKAKGRGQLALFDRALDAKVQQRRRTEQDLRVALLEGGLRVHYQPVIDIATGRTTAYEALVRWDHPERGMLPPDEFLAIAEETGLIVPLGEFVIRQALTEMAGWKGNFRLSINLSPSQIRSVDLLPTIADALAATGFDPSRIEFEITEHVILQADSSATATLDRLRASGIKIALDDFGTGYSSLSYLRRFPFDRIKIDRSFVKDLTTSASSRAIVSTVIALGRSLGMQVTAEGIEDRAQLQILGELGCDEAQGYLILEPLAASELDRVRAGLGADRGDGVLDYAAARDAILRRRKQSGQSA